MSPSTKLPTSPCAGKWLEVPVRPDCFVVNLGDMFQLWSNGKFRSTLHRVVSR